MKVNFLHCMAVLGFFLSIAHVQGEPLIIKPEKWQPGNLQTSGRSTTNITWKSTFIVPEGTTAQRWVLKSNRAGGNFAITVNNKKVAECQGPFIDCPISNVIVGTNTLEVYCSREYQGLSQVSKKTNRYWEELQLNRKYWWGEYGSYFMGFKIAPVIEAISAPGDIRHAHIETSFRKKTATLKMRVNSDRDFTGRVVCTIREWNKNPEVVNKSKEVLTITKDIAFKRGEQCYDVPQAWENPKLWDVRQPNLYVADVKLLVNNQVIDELDRFRFGFREVWTEGRNVMLNGHPFHARVEMLWVEFSRKTIGFWEYLGLNTVLVQPHGNAWLGPWGPLPAVNEEMFEMLDEHGFMATFPAPPAVINFDTSLYQDKEFVESYKKTIQRYKETFECHPCIFAWGIQMNSYNPRHSIAPDQLGQREKPLSDHHEWRYKQYSLEQAHAIYQEADPTRLTYGHGDGNLGSIGTANCYMNNTPVQEIMDYPEYWSQHGDMPYIAVESGIFDGSLAKNNILFVTEYAAIYFGDSAYDRETVAQLRETFDIGWHTGYYGWNLVEDMPKVGDLYWDLSNLFVTAQDRYWRTYGMLAWHHFFYGRYGQQNRGGWNKIEFTEPDEEPEWATKQVEIHRKNKQDLLVYIGGRDHFADQSHSVFEGETFKKNIVIVWDGGVKSAVWIDYKVVDPENGEVLLKGRHGAHVEPGTVVYRPIDFRVPALEKRKRYKIRINAWNDKGMSMKDSFYFEAFPKKREIVKANRGTVYLYDPKGKSEWVKQLATNVVDYVVEHTVEKEINGTNVVELVKGTELKSGDYLIIGREALNTNIPLPYTMNQVDQGLRVLILEQQPTIWEAFGFKNCDMVPRLVFPAAYLGGPYDGFMKGLRTEDLRYWHGTPDLLPEYKFARQVTQPIKGVNRHGVASTVFEIPYFTGAEPLFQCEFNLQYTPLLRFRGKDGRGFLMLSSFDFTGRIGKDPAATQLAENILRQLVHSWNTQQRRQVVTRVEGSNELWKTQILLNEGTCDPKTDEFLAAGGRVLNVALSDEALTKRGIKFEKKKLYRAKLDERGWLARNGATRNMMRWRDEIEFNAIVEPRGECDGMFLQRKNEHFLQITSDLLANRYEGTERQDNWARRLNTTYSMMTLDLLKARILTSLEAEVPADVRLRLNTISVTSPYQFLKTWYAYGPFLYKDAEHVGKFTDVLPGEDQAIRGDINPNFTYRFNVPWNQAKVDLMDDATKQKEFDFRTMVETESDGILNLTDVFKLEGKPSYCYLMHTWEEEKDGEAIFNFSFPTKAVIYANGQKVFSAANLHYGEKTMGIPQNTFPVKIKFRAGSNSIMVKLITLPKAWETVPQQFSVTRSLEDSKQNSAELEKLSKIQFYSTKGTLNNVYLYRFW